jgi:Tfp pilus assembly protein PilV
MAPLCPTSRSANRPLRQLREEAGFTLIELLAAIFILVFGILATLQVFVSSNHGTSVSEAQQAQVHQAQRELERLQSLPYAELGLKKAPSTSTESTNPGYYVSAGLCPTYTTTRSGGSIAGALVINGCAYQYEKTSKVLGESETYTKGAVEPSKSWPEASEASATKLGGTVYDYITWETDPNCRPTLGCPSVNDYKRITVAVTNNSTRRESAPQMPVVVSTIVADPAALPLKGQPKSENPNASTEIKCANSAGETVKCNYGLGTQTANTWYLTDSLEETGYQTPSNQACVHYTNAFVPVPFVCGQTGEEAKCSLSASTYTSCPELDLASTTAPSATSEFHFSENLSATTPGRVLLRDTAVTGTCQTSTASKNASMAEWWATTPLETALKLSGSGGLTLYTRTLKGTSVGATLCVGVYLENPVRTTTCAAVNGVGGKALLDPLNALNNTTCASTKERKDSELLGTVSYSTKAWPAETTPVSFTFSYMAGAREVAAGTSLAVRVWETAASEDDLVLQYDAQSTQSTVQLNSE